MQITHPDILSYREITFSELMQNVESYDHNLLVAYSYSNGSVDENILLIDLYTYCEVDDDCLDFKGKRYNWELLVQSFQYAKVNLLEQDGNFDITALVAAAKYFAEWRAYTVLGEYE